MYWFRILATAGAVGPNTCSPKEAYKALNSQFAPLSTLL